MNHSMPFSVLLLVMFVNNILAQTYQPDLNGDKFVNYSDFTILAANWQKSGSGLSGDIDSSGTVDIQDLARLAEKWLHFSLVIFVDANASPGGNGASWETAFIYIQDGIAAAQSGYEIRVAEGIYRPDANSVFPSGTGLRTSTFELPQGVAIYGGFPAGGGLFQERDWVNNETILTGDIGTLSNRDDNCYNVVIGANDVVLDGFIISDGNATATGDSARGGGMFNEDVNNLIIANCIFRNNYAKYDGGAIYNYQSSMSFINCLFSSNLCGDDGAGVYNSNSNATLTNCAFFDNDTTNRGGGIYNYQTPAQLINCLFVGNHADANGGAIYNGYKSVKMTNCTIANNSSGGNTGGIYNTYSASVITNCIVWDSNTAIYNHSCNPHILYSDIEGCGGSGAGWDPNFGEDDGNNIDIAPSFDNEMALESTSLCIDMGKNPALPLNITTDIKGNARFNGTVDMGAFEFGNLDMNLDTDGDSLPDWWEYRFVLDPDDSNDAQTDLDEDDLPNLNEYEKNCDAAFFDTDSDLLSDGWEVSYSLNPKVSDVIDVNDGNNVYADSDNDGLDTLQEVIFATSPANPDSDDDDANDGAEVAHGGLPFDASDLGLPPSADEICELKLTIGDWSNSNSERYDLKVGPITHQAAKFGVVETKNYNLFRAGNRYEVRLIHRGTDPSKWWYPNADYDYVAQIEAVSLPAGVTMQLEDPDGILGTHGDSNTPNGVFDADGKVAYVTLGTVIDLSDIKFDHTSGDTGDGIDIYDVTAPEWVKGGQNDPAAYKKNTNVTIKARFTVSPDTITSAKIRATTSDGILGNLGEQTVNFSGGVSEYITFTPTSSTPDSIGKDTVLWQWKARDLNGEGTSEYNINVSGPHTVYTVYDSPKCSVSECLMDRFDHAVEWANGGQAVTENDIPKKIQENCWLNFTMPGYLSNPWDLETTPGDCQTHAELMAAALKILGINADGTTESTCRVREIRWCDIHSEWEYHYFVETGGAETNFEGVCEVYLKDESTPWYCYYDKAMGQIGSDPAYQKGNHTNMWMEWNSYPPPNYKVIHHFTYWENHN